MFIVLEGLDGAGKSTQIRMLEELLARCGVACRYLHFPRFDAPLFGDLIARFLRGELGAVEQVDPRLVALLYAGDRGDAAPMIRRWLAAGDAVILDRYVYSNIAFQCAKLPAGEAREELKRWILEMEYNHYDLPRPDVSLFLDVPFAFTESRLTAQREGDDRAYLRGGRDIHESSLDLQRRVREVYLSLAEEGSDFRVIDCAAADGSMASPEAIFSKIEAVVVPLLNSAADV